MKKLFYLFICLFVIGTASAQTCITLQPDAATGKDAYTESVASNANSNGGNYVEFGPLIGTNGGDPDEGRGFIQFDLSSIPSGATILSATLSLYANTTTIQGTPSGTSTYGTNNAAYVKRITSAWTELGITGNNQPTTTTSGQVLLPQSTHANQDYDLDIRNFAQFWVQNPSQNYGVSLQINTSTPYNGHIFASSDHPDAAKHPKLVVCYAFCNTPPTLAFSPTNATSTGSYNGAVSLTVTSICGPFTYNWSGPSGFTASTQNISGLHWGTYNVTVTDLAGNSATGSVDVTAPGSVPTLSQWGLIILSLLTLTLAMAFMLGYQQALVPAGVSTTFAPVSIIRQMPFNKNLLVKVLTVLLPVAMVGFLAVHYFIGTNGVVDFTGTMVSAVIVGYITHMLLEKK